MSTNPEHEPAAAAPGQDTPDTVAAADAELAVAQAQLQVVLRLSEEGNA